MRDLNAYSPVAHEQIATVWRASCTQDQMFGFPLPCKRSSVDSYTLLMGPGYCDTKESVVNSVIPSTVACATKTLSKGSL
jgi:hypothetical protein